MAGSSNHGREIPAGYRNKMHHLQEKLIPSRYEVSYPVHCGVKPLTYSCHFIHQF